MTIPEVFREFEEQQVDQPSPLMNALFAGVAQDWEDNGITREVLAPFAASATWVLPLRFAAALHRLVLTREAPALALHYPTVGGFASPGELWPAAHQLLLSQAATVRELTALPCQTNEVGRCAPLLAGLLHVARAVGKPLRLLEIGASAGLLLAFDKYQYGESFGSPAALCRLPDPGLTVDVDLQIAERAGCDLMPIDPTSAEGRLRLTSSIWGDHLDRFERLRGALAEAARGRVEVERADAAQWLARMLSETGDLVPVVWHSIVRPYVDPAAWSDIERLTSSPGVWRLSCEAEPPKGVGLRVFGPGCPADGELIARGGGHRLPLQLLTPLPRPRP